MLLIQPVKLASKLKIDHLHAIYADQQFIRYFLDIICYCEHRSSWISVIFDLNLWPWS